MITLLESVNNINSIAFDQVTTWNNLEESLRKEEIRYLFTEEGEKVEKAKDNFLKKAFEWFKEQIAKLSGVIQNSISKLLLKLNVKPPKNLDKHSLTEVSVSGAFDNWEVITGKIVALRGELNKKFDQINVEHFGALVSDIKSKLGEGKTVKAGENVNKALVILDGCKKASKDLQEIRKKAVAVANAGQKSAKAAVQAKGTEKVKEYHKIAQAARAFVTAATTAISTIMSSVVSAFSSVLRIFSAAKSKSKKKGEETALVVKKENTLMFDEEFDLDDDEDLLTEEFDLDDDDDEDLLTEEIDLDDDEDLLTEEIDLDEFDLDEDDLFTEEFDL